MRRLMLSGVIGLTFIVAGCQRINVPVPEVQEKQAVEIDNANRLAPIQFDRVGVKIKRGTAIGEYRPQIFRLSGCTGGGNLFWNSGRVLARDVEFADTFYGELKALNFNVVGSPDKLFAGQSTNRTQADYLIGGQIEKIAIDACNDQNIITGFPRGTTSGHGAVSVRWQVFSTLQRKVVYETVTEGAGGLQQGVVGGEMVIIQNAFGDAVRNLAADRKFVDLLETKEPTVADVHKVAETLLLIPRYPTHDGSITDAIDNIRQSVVTIELGNGHGSGFFVTPTLIMTNFHVVENRDLVRVRLLTGRTILGEVIRRHPQRDVAIIQVENAGHRPIPIRTTALKITEEVYAIGSPLMEKLAGTVSKGIVSKFDSNAAGLEDIQADVDIHGGNSGGVLLDKQGNAVGVSYAGYGGQDTSVGLNLFIPIMDALDKLNIGFKSRTEPAS